MYFLGFGCLLFSEQKIFAFSAKGTWNFDFVCYLAFAKRVKLLKEKRFFSKNTYASNRAEVLFCPACREAVCIVCDFDKNNTK
jgi:hypothetical protein